MLTYPSGKPPWLLDSPDSEKRTHMLDILTKTAPEICGWLSLRDPGKKSWRKCYCVLRNSGFYYSSKESDKVSRWFITNKIKFN